MPTTPPLVCFSLEVFHPVHTIVAVSREPSPEAWKENSEGTKSMMNEMRPAGFPGVARE
jgi:hypothetical protein